MISNLAKFDKDSIAETTLRRLGPFMKKKDFAPEEVKKASAACELICQWIRAVNAYVKAKAKAEASAAEKPAAKEKAKKEKKPKEKKEKTGEDKEKTPKEPKPPKVYEIPEWEVSPGKQAGVVSRFFGRKGFGFIQMAAGGDIFVHLSALAEDAKARNLRAGTPVEFASETDEAGKAKAVGVTGPKGGPLAKPEKPPAKAKAEGAEEKASKPRRRGKGKGKGR